MQEGSHLFEVMGVTGVPWIEIDFAADVLRAGHEVLARLQVPNRHGAPLRLPGGRARRARGE